MAAVRIAPSPTGDMHLGTARCAYFNWLVARATGRRFILRIDDTDVERNDQKYVDVILETMAWLDLDPDVVYYQSRRADVYQEYLHRLRDTDAVVELDNGALALNGERYDVRPFVDTIAGEIATSPVITDKIKNNGVILSRGGEHRGQVTYQFASVLDDYLMGVDWIIRGKDHTTNTFMQLAIWHAISEIDPNCEDTYCFFPQFTHLGLIFQGGKKLSKRDNAASMLYYRKQGYSANAMLNFLLRMGWGPKEDNKANSIITRERAIEMFLTQGNMKNSDAGLDLAKLEWFNKKYRQMEMG